MYMQLGTWVDELRQELQAEESCADSLEATERLLEQTAQQRDSSLDACASTQVQGEALLQELRLVPVVVIIIHLYLLYIVSDIALGPSRLLLFITLVTI